MLTSPTSIASADHASAVGTPTRTASTPQIALPMAIPPCSTSKYIDSARALIHDGHIVCATKLKHARMPIHPAPAVNNTRHNTSNTCTCPAAAVIAANNTVDPATNPSTE